MRRVAIIDGVRTPIGRAEPDRGYYRDVRADVLSAHVIRELLRRTAVPANWINDVIWGCVQQQGEQGFNMARTAALLAGLPVEVPATTVSRNCGSSLQALHQAVHAIVAEAADVVVVGGVEHMHHIPMDKDFDPPPELFRKWSPGTLHMGLVAEYMARKYRIDRRAQDEFALRSHYLAHQATETGKFQGEVVPTWGRDSEGRKVLLERDQGIRPDTSLEALARLKPAFDPEGTVTAGNASQVSVGAAALLAMSEEKARELGLTPLAWVVSNAVAGVDPGIMGIGPVPATLKALERAGLTVQDVQLFEVNEAFAVQTLAVIQELGVPVERVNVRGGAIALGHPLGASGARITVTLLHAMKERGAEFGVATMCIGGGMGIASVFQLAA
jgi:acetyl-CoA acyltransferase